MNRSLPCAVRRLVLGSALLAAILAGLPPATSAVRAASGGSAAVVAQGAVEPAPGASGEAAGAARQASRSTDEASSDEDRGAHRSQHRGLRLRIGDLDRQYDSFDQFMDSDPALAAMVLGIVFIVFLTPILIIALVIWYKIRKSRMHNQLMLELAERGVVPPAEAMRAASNGRIEAAVSSAAAALPPAEQVRFVAKRAAWSDLRKGIIMGTIGLALSLYALIEDASASWIGLVLLFLGIGYVVLWYFEERQAVALGSAPAGSATPARGPSDTTS